MRIDFKPQSLIDHLVDEKIIKKGKVIKRIIETSGRKPKTIELTYKKTEFLPTKWYVANYSVVNRDNSNGQICKTLDRKELASNKFFTTIQRYNSNNPSKKVTKFIYYV